MEKLVLIDGNNIMFRSYYALPRLTNFDGVVSNAVFGFCNTLVKVMKDINPKYIAVCFDSGKKNFRHEMYKEYKMGRRPTPQELIDQFPIAKDILKAMNICVVEQVGLEADDLIGILSRKFDNVEKIILTADKDCLQLIGKNVSVMQPQKANVEPLLINESKLMELFGLKPKQIIDFKALSGDSSDNIPGVAGIGEKTAVSLLRTYGTLDSIYNNLDNLSEKTKEKLEADKDNAYLSYKLATIVLDEKLDYDLSDFEYDHVFNLDVLNYFRQYQFNSLLKKTELFKSEEVSTSKVDAEKILITDAGNFKNLDKLLGSKMISFIILDDSINISDGTKEYQINIIKDLINGGVDLNDAINYLKPMLENENVKKIVFDYKSLKHYLDKFGVCLNGVNFDIMIARYLVNSNAQTSVNIIDVINENLLDSNFVAYCMFTLRDVFVKKLKEIDSYKLFTDIEMPLCDVLYDMECQGFKIDREALNELSKKYEEELNMLTNDIYNLAGKKFNINSPKQLSEVLFDDLNITTRNNKKKSTSAQVLNDIVEDHPIVTLIIRYRLISKLYTTYVVAYKDLIDDQDKIYTIFNQTLTTTGRLSSSEPNLQNIPVRTEEGKNLRKLFLPSHKDGYIVDSDYNQIELRLLANFCGDEKLIKAYNDGDDIHASTASEIFGIPKDKVTPDIRRKAKAINFGIVYGISDYGLGQNIGISRTEANEYIKKYFEKYPKIEEYMQSNVEYCKQHGYVKTLFGRVRYIPEINSSQYMSRMFGERAAMNMPLQGTASDIIKLAMIKVYDELKRKKLKSKLILQVHDELVIDATADEVEEVKAILKSVMENVVNLKVKLITSTQVGKNWLEAH